ncbi:MAG: hypothetical protein R3B45_06455 [Bdellovibrionota bacterium]
MNFKKYSKWLVERKPEIVPKHGIPMTRRELLAQGYISGSAFALMPSLAALVSNKALGAEECSAGAKTTKSMTPVLIIDAAGGWSIPGRNIMVGGQGGQDDLLQADQYASIGLTPDADPNQSANAPHADFGLKMASVSRFHEGMMNATQESTRANIDGLYMAIRSNNDTGNNPSNPAKWLVKAGASGAVVNLIGTEDTDFGGNSLGPPESLYVADRPVRVTNPDSAIGLVLPGVLASLSNNNNAFIQKVFKVIKNMSQSQLTKFNGLSAKEQAQILCAYSDAEYQATSFDANSLDPRGDEIFDNTVTSQTSGLPGIFNLASGTEQRTGTLAKLLLDGYVGVAVQRIGGCDYHNNSLTSVTDKDREIGLAAGQFLEAAARKGKNAHVIIYTDGGTGASGNNNDATNFPGINGPTADNGQRSGMFSLTYQAAGGRPELMIGRQIGYFDTSGAIANSNLISDNVIVGAEALVANFIALHTPDGADPAKYIGDELNRVVGRNSFGNDLMKYVSYGRLKTG